MSYDGTLGCTDIEESLNCSHDIGIMVQVIAVGGYGGLVDVISEFGSHLCTFRCKGL